MKILLSHFAASPLSLILKVILFQALFWFLILRRWQRGLYLLMFTTPFMGAISLWLFPLEWPKVLKDILFVLPSYICFFFLTKDWKDHINIPRLVLGALALLAFLVFIQALNPGVENWGMAIIGVKVWLFYIPLMLLSYRLLGEKKNVTDLFRVLLVLAWIPILVGLAQFLGDHIVGHVKTIQFFYGDAGYQASHNYGGFRLGLGYLYRVPSTFTFQAQYFYYLLITIMIAYMSHNIDPYRKWQRFAGATFWITVTAAYLTGARASYVFTPFLIGLMVYLAKGEKPAIKSVSVSLLILFASLTFPSVIHALRQSGESEPNAASPAAHESTALQVENRAHGQPISISEWWIMMRDVAVNDPAVIAYGCIKSAFQKAPWGVGTGMNTGPARLTYADPSKFARYENYYAKTIYELGVPGLLTVLFLFGSLIFYGSKIARSLQQDDLRTLATGIISLMFVFFILSFKGWMMDQDPYNYFFWIFAGFLFRLPDLDGVSQNKGMSL